jgi:hypothetical protein
MRHNFLLQLVAGIALARFSTAPLHAEQKEPVFLGEKYRYPWRVDSSTGMMAPNIEHMRFETKDDFAVVLQYYEHVIGGRIGIENAGALMSTGRKYIADDSREGLRLRVLVHHTKGSSVTVVISQAKGEKHTHVVVTFEDRASNSPIGGGAAYLHISSG